MFITPKDVLFCIKKNMIFLNSKPNLDCNLMVNVGDCIQLQVSKYYYFYIKFCKKFLKKKIALYKYNSWKFFRQKFFKKKNFLKVKKRKTPKYIYIFFLFKLNTSKFFEIDYLTLTIFLLFKQNRTSFKLFSFKLFSFKLFSLYNFKKLN